MTHISELLPTYNINHPFQSTLSQKFEDAFHFLVGKNFFFEKSWWINQDLGLFDWLTLGIPLLFQTLFEFLKDGFESSPYRLKHYLLNILLLIPILFTGILHTSTLALRYAFAAITMLLALPVILITHAVFLIKLKSNDYRNQILNHECTKIKHNIQLIKMLLDKGVDFNFKKDLNYSSALELIFAKNEIDIKIVKLLITKNIDLNIQDKDGYSCLEKIFQKQGIDIEIIRLLLRKGYSLNDKDKNGDTCLDKIIQKKDINLELAELLLENNVHFNARSDDTRSFFIEICKKHPQKINIIEKILQQTKKQNINYVDTILVNENVKSPLLYTMCKINELKVVLILLQYGADPNKPRKDTHNYEFLCLHEAIVQNNVALAKLLLKFNANLNQPYFLKQSSLFWACYWHKHPNFEIIELMLQYGGNPHILEKKYNEQDPKLLKKVIHSNQHKALGILTILHCNFENIRDLGKSNGNFLEKVIFHMQKNPQEARGLMQNVIQNKFDIKKWYSTLSKDEQDIILTCLMSFKNLAVTKHLKIPKYLQFFMIKQTVKPKGILDIDTDKILKEVESYNCN